MKQCKFNKQNCPVLKGMEIYFKGENEEYYVGKIRSRG